MDQEQIEAQELIDAFVEDFEKRGTEAIEDLRKNNLSAYWRIITGICCNEINE